MGSQTPPQLPIIDFTIENLKPGTDSWLLARKEVQHAFENYGCFVARYDKVSLELNKDLFGIVKDLFDLPTEIKTQNVSEKMYFGYVGNLSHLPIHESMGIEDSTTLEGVESFAKLMWPSGNDKFCETMLLYAKQAAELEQMVSKMVYESYGVENHYDSHIGSATYLLRMFKYRAPEMNESNRGADIHTDASFTTILNQSQVSALEAENRNGDWIPVDFPPQSFVVMAGDKYSAWSNGRILAPRHHVTLRENKTRYSVALFAYTNGKIGTLEELIGDKNPN